MKQTHRNIFLLPILGVLLSSCASIPLEYDKPETENGQQETVPASEILTITAVGDVMLGGSATPELEKYGYDYPFEKTKYLLLESDIVFANLEGPLTTRGKEIIEKKYKFRAQPQKVAPALKKAGINVVSLANNHTLDYGEQGLLDTMAALDENGIAYAGAGKNNIHARVPAILEVKNIKIALLAYSLTFPEEFWAKHNTAGTAFGHQVHVKEDITRAGNLADVVIVSFHWGREATTELRPYQITLGRAAIDAGASVVLGHHPHVLQAVERYKQGVILYSLGNYVFGSYSKKATRSVIAQLTLKNKRLTALQLIPINVNNVEVIFQPTILDLEQASSVIQELKTLSRQRGTTIQNKNGVAVVLLNNN